MERVNLLAPDVESNWQMNRGIPTYGRIAADQRWFATARKPNAPALSLLVDAVLLLLPGGLEAAAVSSTVILFSVLASLLVVVTPTDTDGAVAGEEGAALSVSTCCDRHQWALTIDTDGVAGSYYVWVTWEKEVALLGRVETAATPQSP